MNFPSGKWVLDMTNEKICVHPRALRRLRSLNR